jgi:arylsulfatase A-like enzyme
MYDTSIKVPFILSHRGSIPEGLICDALLSGYDFMPTLLDYVGIPLAEGETRLPGTSFAPLLTRGGDRLQSPSRPVIVFDEYGPVRMIRSQEWKYVHRYPYGPHELYDLVSDPQERVNRADDPACREVRKELKGILEEWFIQYADPRLDGTREPVTGKGQLNLAGPSGHGEKAFHELE